MGTPSLLMVDGSQGKMMMKRPTISDVAALAGVSKSTISQYLNKRYKYMSEQTQEKIRIAIKELNYQPNELARGLKRKKTSMIGIIVATLVSEFTTEIIRRVEGECLKRGVQLVICNVEDDHQKERQYINTLVARQLDGLIVFPHAENKELYLELIEHNYPLVFLDREISGVVVPTILFDNAEASRIAVEQFVKKGHEKIAVLTKPIGEHFITVRTERVDGYKRGLLENGLLVRNEYIYSVEMEKIQDSLAELFSIAEPPTALLAGNDMILEEILVFAKEHQYAIPDHFSVIGIDDASFTRFYTPAITTISQPTYDMGKKAAQVLLDMIDEKAEMTMTYRFPPQLNDRESVKELL